MSKQNEFIKIHDELYRVNSINQIAIRENGNEVEVNINGFYHGFNFHEASVEERQELLDLINELSDICPQVQNLFNDIIAKGNE